MMCWYNCVCVLFHISGMTALELWCLSCITFTFGTILSYVIILVKISIFPQKGQENYPERCAKIEIFLFLCTFGGFAVFNLCFWLTYLH